MNMKRIMELVATLAVENQWPEIYKQACRDLNDEMSVGHLSALKDILENGPKPLDAILFNDRCYELASWGLIVSVCLDGLPGFYAATHRGYNVFSAVDRTKGMDS